MSAMNTGGSGSASLAIICYPYQGLRKICGEDRKEENLSKVQQYARTLAGNSLWTLHGNRQSIKTEEILYFSSC